MKISKCLFGFGGVAFSLALVAPSFARVDALKSITLKSDLYLSEALDGFPGSSHTCYDLELKEQVDTELCRNRPDRSRRLCSLLVYNLEAAVPVQRVSAGTTFLVNRQFGPKIDNDWDRRISILKIFSNRSGVAHDFSNPNLIIDCRQSYGNYRRPAEFSFEEVGAALADQIDLQY